LGDFSEPTGEPDAFTMTATAAHRVFGFACCTVLGLITVPQHAALAQDAPRLCVVAAYADTGAVHAMGDLPGAMLIGAENGLFLARETGGKVTVAPAGNGDTGRVLAIHAFPGGMLIGTTWRRWFVARAKADANVTLTPAGKADPGRVTLMRDFAGGVLIGAERGVFVAGPVAGAGCAGR
jgi:hypothetical protein